MGVGHAFLHDEPHDVIDVGDDERAVERQPDGRSPIPFQSHVERQRQPHECRADDRNDRRQASEDTPEERARRSEEQVAQIGDHALHGRQQRNADGVRADDHADFVQGVAADAAAEGQQLPAIGLHAEAADEHEIEYEEQHDQIDGERGQAADEPLREFGIPAKSDCRLLSCQRS